MYYPTKIDISSRIIIVIKSESGAIPAEPNRYLKHRALIDQSVNTIRAAAASICYYLNFLEEKNTLINEVFQMNKNAQYEHFADFLHWIKTARHKEAGDIPNNNTANSHLERVIAFLVYLNEKDLKVLEEKKIYSTSAVGVRSAKQIKVFPCYLPADLHVSKIASDEEINTLIGATRNLRDTLYTMLIRDTGIRLGEALGIWYTHDVDFDKQTVRVRHRNHNENEALGKNHEDRTLSFSDETADIMMLYLSKYPDLLKDSPYLFVKLEGPNKGEPMDKSNVNALFASLEERTGIHASSHMFRHFFADERRKAGWSIEEISVALGHRKIETTMNYLHITELELAEAQKEYLNTKKIHVDIARLL